MHCGWKKADWCRHTGSWQKAFFRGHSPTTWTQFYPILTPFPPRVDHSWHFTWYLPFFMWPIVDFLVSTDPAPSSSCPHSYWMTPYCVRSVLHTFRPDQETPSPDSTLNARTDQSRKRTHNGAKALLNMDTRLFRIVAFEFVSILVLTLKVFSKVFNNEFYEKKIG